VRIFPDTIVLLAACVSSEGASSEIFRIASLHGWTFITTPYVLDEVNRHLPDLPAPAWVSWMSIRAALIAKSDVLTLSIPTFFSISKDRPVLYGAFAWADVLLTLDQADFGILMNGPFYGLRIVRPGVFLEEERRSGRL
jgi:predicted nucleic acid-binding protein